MIGRAGAAAAVCIVLGGWFVPAAMGERDVADEAGARRLAGWRLAQLARSVLVEPQPTHPSRVAVAAELLERATEAAPDDAELWRLRIEAMEMAGPRPRLPGVELPGAGRSTADTAVAHPVGLPGAGGGDASASLREALGAYLRLRPDDDAAQWRLVELLAAEAQTAERRLRVYEGVAAGRGAERLSAALRSRAALRAAMLRRAQGEEGAYGRLLSRAIELDGTNRAAAEEAYLLLRERSADAVELAQALLNLLAADPVDPAVRAEVGRMLLGCGQYEEALPWLASASQVWAVRGGATPEARLRLLRDWSLALWGAGRGEQAVGLIESAILPEAAGEAPAILMSILTAIHTAAGEEGEAAAAFERLIGTLRRRGEAAPNPGAPGLADRIWAHLLFNRSIDRAGPLMQRLEEMEGAEGLEAVAMRRLRGWRLLREGDAEAARAMLAACAESDLGCRYGLALVEAEGADEPGRAGTWQAVWARSPGTLLGLMAAQRLHRAGARPIPSAQCRAIADPALRTPDDVKRLPERAARFLRLRGRVARPTVGFAEPIEVELELTNLSAMPLSLGTDGTLPGDVLLSCDVAMDEEEGGDGDRRRVVHAVDMGRRLRLGPGQSVRMVSRVDVGPLGELLSHHPARWIGIELTAVAEPRVDGSGRYAPGLLGKRVAVGRVERLGWAIGPEQIDAKLAEVRGGERTAALRAAALLMSVTGPEQRGALPGLPGAGDRLERIVEHVVGLYERAGPAQRAWLLSHVPSGGASAHGDGAAAGGVWKPLIDAAVGGDQPVVQQALLVRQAERPDSPILHEMLRRPAGPVRRMAENLHAALGRGEAPDQDIRGQAAGP